MGFAFNYFKECLLNQTLMYAIQVHAKMEFVLMKLKNILVTVLELATMEKIVKQISMNVLKMIRAKIKDNVKTKMGLMTVYAKLALMGQTVKIKLSNCIFLIYTLDFQINQIRSLILKKIPKEFLSC